MLKVDSVKSAINGAEGSIPNFGKSVPISSVTSGIDQFMPKGVKQIQKVSDNLGEGSTILINAAGTGFIAPIFIKNNPFSKADEDTRTYSAWRQPLSAVLAIGTQFLAILPFNRAMNNGFNLGMLSDQYNMSAFQDDNFIGRQVKKNNPDFTKEQVKNEVKRIKQKQADDLLRNILENNTVKIRKYGQDGIIDIDKKVFDNAVNDSIDGLISLEIKEKSKLINEKKVNRIRRREFYRTNNQKTLDYITQIEEILKKDNLEEIRKILKEKSKNLSKTDNELKLITEEILGLSEGVITTDCTNIVLDTMRAKADKVKTVAKEYGKKKSLEEVIKAVEAELSPKLAEADNNINFFKELKTKISSGAKVKEIQELIAQRASNNNEFAQKGLNFAQNVAESLKSRVKGSTRCIKQIGGVAIGLIVLPITCTLLNKIYPVFMDKFFPELSDKKKAKTVKLNTVAEENASLHITESEVKNAA